MVSTGGSWSLQEGNGFYFNFNYVPAEHSSPKVLSRVSGDINLPIGRVKSLVLAVSPHSEHTDALDVTCPHRGLADTNKGIFNK